MGKLSDDKANLVKNEFAKTIVKIFPYFSKDKVQDNLLPMAIKLIRDSNLEIASSILCDFKEMIKHLPSGKY